MGEITALGFWRYADEFLRAATVVEASAKRHFDILPPRYYLLGHSIELALKAFLLAKGVTPTELRLKQYNMAHNLEKALVRAEGLGLADVVNIPPKERTAIMLLNKTYGRKSYEYLETGSIHIPPTDTLFSVVNRVLPAIKHLCIDATLKDKSEACPVD